jgi:hypothetical protein
MLLEVRQSDTISLSYAILKLAENHQFTHYDEARIGVCAETQITLPGNSEG